MLHRFWQALLIFITFACLAIVTATSQARAQAPYVYYGYWGNIPYGYGYFNYFPWPTGNWNYPNVYGYGYGYGWNYPQPTYGVIAYSPTTDTGSFSWGQSSLDAATRFALNQCEAEDCRSIVWVQGGCAGLAVSTSDKKLGWAYADTRQRAVATATRACVSSGGIDCKGRGWVCSF